MSVIAGLAEETENGALIFGKDNIFGFFTAASAYAFMVFNLFSAPCFGAIGALKRELGSTKKMLKVVLFQTIFAWILATLVYQIGSRIENNTFNITNIILIILILILVLKILFKNKKNNCNTCPYCKSCNK